MLTRSATAPSRTVSALAAKRWLLLLQRMAPPQRAGGCALTGLECDLICRLWSWTWSDPRTRVVLDDAYSIDAWMTRIVIYVIKFYGTSYGPLDRALVLWIIGNSDAADQMDNGELMEMELETCMILSPHVLHVWDDENCSEFANNVAPRW